MIMTIVTISSMSQTHFFAHFMRRRSLLETIISLIRTGVPPSFNVWHQSNQAVINYDDSGMPCSFSFSITGLQEASSHREVYGVRSIPWSEWGPPISRWLDAGDMTRSWTITPIGQRWLRLDPVDDGDEIYRFSVIDFNPYNIYNPQDDLPGELVVGRKGDYFDHHNVFVEEIEMGLNCITYTAPEVYSGYDMWLMDDENVLALKVCARCDFWSYTYSWQSVENQDIWGGDIIEKMAVFHFGWLVCIHLLLLLVRDIWLLADIDHDNCLTAHIYWPSCSPKMLMSKLRFFYSLPLINWAHHHQLSPWHPACQVIWLLQIECLLISIASNNVYTSALERKFETDVWATKGMHMRSHLCTISKYNLNAKLSSQ